MYRSLQLTLPLKNIIFGSRLSISPENITDEMKNNDRYDCYKEGAFHNSAFCSVCDILKLPIQFHQLYDHYLSQAGREISEIIVFHSQDDYNTFIAFTLWWGCTDQFGVIETGVFINEKLWDKIYDLFEIISCDCIPYSSPCIDIPSKLTESLLDEHNGKCHFDDIEYTVYHIK